MGAIWSESEMAEEIAQLRKEMMAEREAQRDKERMAEEIAQLRREMMAEEIAQLRKEMMAEREAQRDKERMAEEIAQLRKEMMAEREAQRDKERMAEREAQRDKERRAEREAQQDMKRMAEEIAQLRIEMMAEKRAQLRKERRAMGSLFDMLLRSYTYYSSPRRATGRPESPDSGVSLKSDRSNDSPIDFKDRVSPRWGDSGSDVSAVEDFNKLLDDLSVAEETAQREKERMAMGNIKSFDSVVSLESDQSKAEPIGFKDRVSVIGMDFSSSEEEDESDDQDLVESPDDLEEMNQELSSEVGWKHLEAPVSSCS